MCDRHISVYEPLRFNPTVVTKSAKFEPTVNALAQEAPQKSLTNQMRNQIEFIGQAEEPVGIDCAIQTGRPLTPIDRKQCL